MSGLKMKEYPLKQNLSETEEGIYEPNIYAGVSSLLSLCLISFSTVATCRWLHVYRELKASQVHIQ